MRSRLTREPESGANGGRLLRGREDVQRWFREVDEQFDEWRSLRMSGAPHGTASWLLDQLHVHGREIGITFDQPVGWLFEVRDAGRQDVSRDRQLPSGKGKATLSSPGTREWDARSHAFRGREIAKAEMFRERAQALEAAGLSE